MSDKKERGKKQPKHFKVHCSIQNHRRMIGVYDDDSLLAMFTRIGIMAVERYADKTGDSFICSGRDLERLAACSGVANAIRKLERLAAAGGPALVRPTSGQALAGTQPTLGGQGHSEATGRPVVGQKEAGYRLTFRNFAKKQGFVFRSNQSAMDSSTTTTTTTTEREKSAPSARTQSDDSGPPDLSKLVRVLSRFDGEDDEKTAWLDAEFALIQAEAAADPNPKRLVPITIRYYRAYLNGARPFRDWAAKQASYQALAEHQAECEAAMRELEESEGYAAAHR